MMMMWDEEQQGMVAVRRGWLTSACGGVGCGGGVIIVYTPIPVVHVVWYFWFLNAYKLCIHLEERITLVYT